MSAYLKAQVDQGILAVRALTVGGKVLSDVVECKRDTQCLVELKSDEPILVASAGFTGRSGQAKMLYHISAIGRWRIIIEDEESEEHGEGRERHMGGQVPEFGGLVPMRFGLGFSQTDVTSFTIDLALQDGNPANGLPTMYVWRHEKGVEKGIAVVYPYVVSLDYLSHLNIAKTVTTWLAEKGGVAIPAMVHGFALMVEPKMVTPKAKKEKHVIVRRKGIGQPVIVKAKCDDDEEVGVDFVSFDRGCRRVEVRYRRGMVTMAPQGTPTFVVEYYEDGQLQKSCEVVGDGECVLEPEQAGSQTGATSTRGIVIISLVAIAMIGALALAFMKFMSRGKSRETGESARPRREGRKVEIVSGLI